VPPYAEQSAFSRLCGAGCSTCYPRSLRQSYFVAQLTVIQKLMSSLSWIDFDENDRQRVRGILALFEEKETRDELGLGPIRDSIADHLFPGTSTLQTRLRYMFFIPWIYMMVQKDDTRSHELVELARGREIRLIDSLRCGGEEEGVIGRAAGASLKRLPSSIYWTGLKSWGIRIFPGSQEAYFASLPSLRRHRHRSRSADHSSAIDGFDKKLWSPGLPRPPRDLLEQADFRLTHDEAGFLIDRLVNSQPNSLLAHLARSPRRVECEFVWAHPDFSAFPPAAKRLVEHAKVFSAVLHGASLLYNLMLAECGDNEDWVERYRAELSRWKTDEFDQTAVSDWSLPEFWDCIKHENHRVQYRSRSFVEKWRELAHEKCGEVADLESARELVREREKALKRSQSRFVNHAVLARWGGRSGADRLNFRWREANSHVRDLADAD